MNYRKRIPHHEAISFLIADKEGAIARVEAAPEGVDVALTQDGTLAVGNSFQSEQMAHLDRVPAEGDLVYRPQERMTAWYDDHKGQIGLNTARRLCSDHEIGLCVTGRPGLSPLARFTLRLLS